MHISEGLKGGLVGGLASTILTATLLLSVFAVADGNPQNSQVPELVPYQGRLEFNGVGQSLTGTDAPWMRFELTDGAGGDVVFQQDSQVEVYSGHFSVVLGTNDGATNYVQSGSLTKAITDADDLYLHITLLNEHNPASPDADAGDNVTMNNPQRLLRSPFAFWATNSASFDVAADLEVGTTISSGGKITASTGGIEATVGNISAASGDVTASNDIKAGGDLVVTSEIYDDTDDYVNINDGLSVGGHLAVLGEVTSSLGDTLSINDNLSVQGTLETTNNITSDGNVTAKGNLLVQGEILDSNDGTVVVGEALKVEGNTTIDGTTHFGGSQTIASSAEPACLVLAIGQTRSGTQICENFDSSYSCRMIIRNDNGAASGSSDCSFPSPNASFASTLCCRQ